MFPLCCGSTLDTYTGGGRFEPFQNSLDSVKTFSKTSIVKVENRVHSPFRCLTSPLNYLPESSISYWFHCAVSPRKEEIVLFFMWVVDRAETCVQRTVTNLLCSPLFHNSADKTREKREILCLEFEQWIMRWQRKKIVNDEKWRKHLNRAEHTPWGHI